MSRSPFLNVTSLADVFAAYGFRALIGMFSLFARGQTGGSIDTFSVLNLRGLKRGFRLMIR